MSTSDRLEDSLRLIDEANNADPKLEVADGEKIPAALLYGRRMSAWVERLKPEASDALRIAARAQHIRRWEVPRDTFPMDRAGYHRWRTGLYTFHGDRAAEIMRETGYDDETIDRVRFILLKKKLKTDPEVQTLEDAAALVFLEHHLAEFAAREDMTEEKLIDILQKTWAKMSDHGREAALGLELAPELEKLLQRALQ